MRRRFTVKPKMIKASTTVDGYDLGSDFANRLYDVLVNDMYWSKGCASEFAIEFDDEDAHNRTLLINRIVQESDCEDIEECFDNARHIADLLHM